MAISGVSATNANTKPLINAKNTGYIAATSMGLAILSGMSNNKTIKQSHKFFAGTSFAAMITHMYIVLARHHKPKHAPHMPNPDLKN